MTAMPPRNPIGVPGKGTIAPAPVPPMGGGAAAAAGASGGTSCSWDPAIFRPEKPVVSCYCGLQFPRGELPKVSEKGGTRPMKEGVCGEWVRKLKSGDVFKDIYHNCDDLKCSFCMDGAITGRAHDVEDRHKLYEKAKLAHDAVLIDGEIREITSRQIIFSISPSHQEELLVKVKRALPGDWGTEHEQLLMDLYRDEEDQAIKISGLVAGAKFYHDARVKHADTGNTGSRGKLLIKREAMVAGNMTDTDPSWKLYDHIRKQENWQDYYYLSLHTHVQGYGTLIDAEEFEKLMPGWKYHNKGPIRNVGGLSRYLISHMAIIPERRSITYFGRMSSASLGKEGIKTYSQVQVHPVTKIPWIIVESTIPEEVGGTYSIEVTDYRAFFRKPEPWVKLKEFLLKFGGNSPPEDQEPDPDDKVPEGPVTLMQWSTTYEARYRNEIL